jgi:LysM repeat protein
MNQIIKIITLSIFLLAYFFEGHAFANFNQNKIYKNLLNIPAQEEVIVDSDRSFLKIKYRIRRNDNLWEISKRFEVDLNSLVQFNNLLEPDKIFPGDELIIKFRIGTFPYKVTIKSKKGLRSELAEVKQDSFMRVIHPDINNPLAPSVPLAYFDGPEDFNFGSKISGPRRVTISPSFSKLLQNINSIFKLLNIDVKIPFSKEITSSYYFFPGFNLMINQTSPHFFSNNLKSCVYIDIDLYKNLISSQASPPPKYL